MEDAFEEREQRFEHEAAERTLAAEAGKEVESTLIFDLGQLDTTRRLARQVADAEDALDTAKAAAVAAGVQIPGSDIESGFVDDVHVGYRISSDEEYAGTMDGAAIEKWMDLVPDGYTEETPEVEIEDWDAQSVDTCDSFSMVAVGPGRHRIDKWRKICAST